MGTVVLIPPASALYLAVTVVLLSKSKKEESATEISPVFGSMSKAAGVSPLIKLSVMRL